METRCEVCGGSFEAKRRTARFCSSKCRVRAHRGAQVVELPAEKPARVTAEAPMSSGSVEAAVVKQLAEVERVDTPMGQAALVLARRLDGGAADTGSAVAALVKQLEATLEAATAGAKAEDDPVDELRKRRDRKLGIAG